jgi:hypothetical protein
LSQQAVSANIIPIQLLVIRCHILEKYMSSYMRERNVDALLVLRNENKWAMTGKYFNIIISQLYFLTFFLFDFSLLSVIFVVFFLF